MKYDESPCMIQFIFHRAACHLPPWVQSEYHSYTMLRFTARNDWQLDQRLLPFDLLATKAHVRGLGRIGALDEAEVTSLVVEIERIESEVEAGRFVLTEQHEDGHTAIEMELTQRLGETGKKVHLGRSRKCPFIQTGGCPLVPALSQR